MWPPSSCPNGSRFRKVRNSPNHAANATGCSKTVCMPGAVGKKRYSSACTAIPEPSLIGWPANSTIMGRPDSGGSATDSDNAKPRQSSSAERTKLTAGPPTPMSKSTERLTNGPRMRMNAPRVPIAE